MPAAMQVHEYMRAVRELDEAAFIERYPHPVLLHRDQEGSEAPRGFHTGVTDAKASKMEILLGLTSDPAMTVIPIASRDASIFQDRVSVGRTRNNDVMLPYPKVSKFHGYFSWNDERTIFYFTDAGSTNGTFVDGEPVPPKSRVRLSDRSVISFSRHYFRFHRPDGFYQVVRQLTYG